MIPLLYQEYIQEDPLADNPVPGISHPKLKNELLKPCWYLQSINLRE